MKRLQLFILIALLLCGLSFGTDYYVKNGGNDGADGLSDGNAWATIGQVNSEMGNFNPGDNIYFKRGSTFNDVRLHITCSGTSGNIITFGAYDSGAKPIFDGASHADTCLDCDSGENYITIDNIKFQNMQTNKNGIVFQDALSTNITISNCDFDSSVLGHGIYLDEVDTYDIDTCTFVDLKAAGISIHGSANNKITNGTIQNCTINGNDFIKDGISFHRSGADGTGQNHYIYNCEFYDCLEQGIDIDWGDHILIRDCTTHGNAIGGIGCNYVNMLYIEGYYSYDENKPSIFAGGDDTTDNIIIVGSRFDNSERQVLELKGGSDWYILNNTLVGGVALSRSRVVWFSDEDGNTVSDCTFKNNIVSHTQSNSHYCISYSSGTATTTSTSADYNYYWNPSGSSAHRFYDGTAGIMTFATWQSTYSQDTNSAFADPKLTDPANNDFTLQADSPCIGAGGWITTITSVDSSGTVFVVADSNPFHDGFGVTTGSVIQLEGDASSVTVTDINYGTDTITVGASVTWTQGDGVAFAFDGSYPDMGAVEYEPLGGGSDQVDFPNIYIEESVAPGGVGSQADPYSDFSEINWTTGGDNSVFDYYAGSPALSVTINHDKGETWREQLTIGHSGTAAYPLIVRAYGSGADPIISGSDLVSTWTATSYGADVITNGDFSGETLGTELVVNGDMELDSDWTSHGFEGGETDERSAVRKHDGTYSRHVIVDANAEGTKQVAAFACVEGDRYRVDFWYYIESGGIQFVRNRAKIDVNQTYTTSGSWIQANTGDYWAVDTDTELWKILGYNGPNSEFYADDVTTKVITLDNWTCGDYCASDGAGKAMWSGDQSGNSDLTQTTVLTSGVTYRVTFTVSSYVAGNVVAICGTQAGTSRSADDTFIENIVSNGTSLIIRGDVDFDGKISNVVVEPAVSNVWEATLATEPTLVWFDGSVGTIQTAVVNVDSAGDWYWASNLLHVYYGEDPDGAVVMEAAARDSAIIVGDKSYITFDGLEVCHNNSTTAGVVQVYDSSYITLENCSIHDGNYGVIHFFYNDGGNCDYNTVDTCTVSGCYRTADEYGAVIKFNGNAGSCAYNTVKDCTISDAGNTTYSILIQVYASDNNTIESNAFSGPSGNGIYMRPNSDNNIVRYNSLDDVGLSIHMRENSNDNEVYYNTINVPGSGIVSNGIAATNDGSLIYNNTLYGTAQNKNGIHITGTNTNCVVKNNIVLVGSGSNTADAFLVDANSVAGTTADNNCFRNGTGTLIDWDGTTYTMAQFATYQSASSQDANSFTADPLMTNPASDDFTLQVGSLCINRGAHVGLFLDYLGLPVPIGHLPDIGAYEHKNGGVIY